MCCLFLSIRYVIRWLKKIKGIEEIGVSGEDDDEMEKTSKN